MLALLRATTPNPQRLLVADGLWAHNAVLASGAAVESFFWCPEAAYSDEARTRAGQMAARARHCYQISARTLARMSERERPDGLVSVAVLPRWQPEQMRFGEQALVLVADAMEIPGNLGTVLRTLDACRADCLVLTNRRTRLTHPKVLRASQGTCLTVPSVEFDTVPAAAQWLWENQFRVLLADTGGEPYRAVDLTGRVALVVGSERYGICGDWYVPRHQRIAVPMLGHADSLNVSVSASILLYEARAQQAGW